MPKKIDSLVGGSYGRLAVVSEVPKIGNRRAYECICACGNKKTILAQSLRNGATQSCGCLNSETSYNSKNFKDLEGSIFGKWKVIKRIRRKGSDGALFECQCECGTRRIVTGDSLKRGVSKSCGCVGSIKQICKNGHDTSILGRTSSDACRACIREKRLITLYGITSEEYQKLWNLQEGKCAICETTLQPLNEIGKPGWGNGVRVEVDHDHDEGLTPRQAVRGLLCGGRWKGCNRRLGKIDNLQWLKKVIEYLEKPPAQILINSLER
jgi:hypothetical protein